MVEKNMEERRMELSTKVDGLLGALAEVMDEYQELYDEYSEFVEQHCKEMEANDQDPYDYEETSAAMSACDMLDTSFGEMDNALTCLSYFSEKIYEFTLENGLEEN